MSRRFHDEQGVEWVTVAAAAEHAEVDPRTINTWVRSGMPSVVSGRERLIKVLDLQAQIRLMIAAKKERGRLIRSRALANRESGSLGVVDRAVGS